MAHFVPARMNQPTFLIRSSRLLALLGASVAGTASALTVSIGTQHFTEGQIVTSAAFTTAVTGQPAPFDSIKGGDVAGPDFASAWTFNYAAQGAGTVSAATLTLGLWDGDTAASGSQLSLLQMDAVVFTSLADAVFEATPGAQGQYRVYTINLPPALLASLEDGVAAVTFNLKGPGLGVAGETTNNGAGLDFARLVINPVPEPSSSSAALAAAGLLLLQRRRTARA